MVMSEVIVHKPSAVRNSLVRVSGFQIKTLIFALLVGMCGALGMSYHWFNSPEQSKPITITADGISFVAAGVSETSSPELDEDPWSKWMSQKGFKIGISFIGGFIIGFIFRTFVKTMLFFTVCVVGILGALSYFQVVNIDFSHAEQAWNSNSEWIMTQATKLKDMVWQYLPSSTTGTIGAFVGARRKAV